jgi:hypothetical protein
MPDLPSCFFSMSGEAVMKQSRKFIVPLVIAVLATTGTSAGSSAQDSRTQRSTVSNSSALAQVQPSRVQRESYLNTAALTLVQPAQVLSARPDRPRRVDINWTQVTLDFRQQSSQQNRLLVTANFAQTLPRPVNAAAARVTETRLPVLLPNLAALDLPDGSVSRLFPQADFYTFTLTSDGILIEVFGTRLAHAEAPDPQTARRLQLSDGEGFRVTATEYGRELEFTRYGAAYAVTIECDDPEGDPRCSSEDYARRVARSLLIAAGSPGEEE